MWTGQGFKVPFDLRDRSDWPPVVQTDGECDRRPYTEEQAREQGAEAGQVAIGACPICRFTDGGKVWHIWPIRYGSRFVRIG